MQQTRCRMADGGSTIRQAKRRSWLTDERLLTLCTLALALLVWFLTERLAMFSQAVVPSPQKVLESLWDIFIYGYKGSSLLMHLGSSLLRLGVAFVLVVVTAVPLGLMSGYHVKIRAVVDPFVEFYRPLPPLAYYTLLVLWLGIDDASKVALLYLAGFAPVYIACMAGVKKIKPDYIHGAHTLGANKRQVFRYVVFPACLPDIFVGLRTALGVAYTTLVAAEMVAAVNGIGWMVLDASKFLRSDIVFAGILIMGITGVMLDRLLRLLERSFVPWSGKE